MSQDQFFWAERFVGLLDRGIASYEQGQRDIAALLLQEDIDFLASIGYRPRELYDFIEDAVAMGEPGSATALLIAAVRRDYFLFEQGGRQEDVSVYPDDLPSKSEELGGIAWLPRVIAKARGKLRGQLDEEIMYSCPGDMGFFKRHGLEPADFLRAVWRLESDEAILEFVCRSSP